MYKILAILIISFNLITSHAQESIILKKIKVNWKDYPKLFSDKNRSEFTDEYALLANVDIYIITYLSDGLKIESYAAIPKAKGKYPVIIYNRGGNRDFYALQLFDGKSKYPVAFNFSKLANEGYIVIGCNYRGGGKSEGKDEIGGKDVNDVINLIDVVKEIPEAEKKVYAKLIPDYWNNKEEELRKRSAVYLVENFPTNVPILMIHGNADWRAKATNSLRLALEFEKRRIPYRLKIYEGANHEIDEYPEDTYQEIISWFDRFLKQNEKIPDMEFH